MRIFKFGGSKRCRYADRCRHYQPGHDVCEDDNVAGFGKSGHPYCGAFRNFRDFEHGGSIEA